MPHASGTVWAADLRQHCFRGSGRIFTLPDERDWATLGFQSSTASTGDEARFTINLMVVGKAAWEGAREQRRWLSARPSPNTIAEHRYQQRIGHLIHGRDHWWRLRGNGSNQTEVAAEVLAAIHDHAIPVLRREVADQSPGPRRTFGGIRT